MTFLGSALVSVLFALSPLEPPAARPAAAPALSGTVVTKSGQGYVAVPSAVVTVTDVQQSTTISVLSGTDGRFHVPDLRTGLYTISATRASYVRRVYGAMWPDSEGVPIRVDGVTQSPDVTIELVRGAVVSGRVSDETGEPLRNAEVALLRVSRLRASNTISREHVIRTDDRGEYRIHGIAGGEFVLSVTEPSLSWTAVPMMSTARVDALLALLKQGARIAPPEIEGQGIGQIV